MPRQEFAMDTQPPGTKTQATENEKPIHAEHGTPSEVSWDSGAGHQPYSNQGPVEGPPPNHDDVFPEGDRGEASGRNLEQLEEVKKMP
jgi:hypothetical protein